ncbi:MAG: hypothetical protein DMG40_09575 [Acidobacteria bacterium]|nr:MAG: hypothetical protein DMG40_09575 [Acidobacteriota bacterium]
MLLENRKQPRTPERFLLHILAARGSRFAELATVENVSSSGTRLATRQVWKPGSQVILKSSAIGDAYVRARVVYCHVSTRKGFAIGLNFLTTDKEGKRLGKHAVCHR